MWLYRLVDTMQPLLDEQHEVLVLGVPYVWFMSLPGVIGGDKYRRGTRGRQLWLRLNS